MTGKNCTNEEAGDLDELIEEIIVDCYGGDEQFWGFRQVLEDEIPFPVDAFVIGEPVSVVVIDYEGDKRRGLMATCRRKDGSEHVVSACDVVIPQGWKGARYLAAYRKWMDLEPYPAVAAGLGRPGRQHVVAADQIDLSLPVELVVLAVKPRAVPCRMLGGNRVITLRPSRFHDLVPGEIVTVKPRKQWSFSGHRYLSGEIESSRIDVDALGLVPLKLYDEGVWDPPEYDWGDPDAPLDTPTKQNIAAGSRPAFRMEQVLPGDDPDTDPIDTANDLIDAGDREEALKILMDLCRADLRCLDAHAHLAALRFDFSPEVAIRHYEVGVKIGEPSLGDEFDGVLPWAYVDNRPFHRCMRGYGRCLWRLERFEEAAGIYQRLLRLDPTQKVGSSIEHIRAGNAWQPPKSVR